MAENENPNQESPAKSEPTSSGRHAVFDETLQQYVGGTHASKSDAGKAKTAAGKTRRHADHELTVRAV